MNFIDILEYLIIIAFLFYNKCNKVVNLYQVMLNASGFGWNILISLSCCGLTFDKHECFARNILLYSQIIKKGMLA